MNQASSTLREILSENALSVLIWVGVAEQTNRENVTQRKDWSPAINLMATGTALLDVPQRAGRLRSDVSLHIHRESHTWRIALLPGCLVVNKSAGTILLSFQRLALEGKVEP